MAGEYPMACIPVSPPFSRLFLQRPVYTLLSLSMLLEANPPHHHHICLSHPCHRRDGLWLSSYAIWEPEQSRACIGAKVVTAEDGTLCPCLDFMPASRSPTPTVQRAVCVCHLPRHSQKTRSLSFCPHVSPESPNPARFWPGEEPHTTLVPGTCIMGMKPNPSFRP